MDIETIGDFCSDYDDFRRYCKIRPTVFGYIDKHDLNVICTKEMKGIQALKKEIIHALPHLRNPLACALLNYDYLWACIRAYVYKYINADK